MNTETLTITHVGGPTALLEFGDFRLLTDPTFDPPGREYTTGPVTLHKVTGPSLRIQDLGRIDAVLLSHDHHFDNLDHAGRAFLTTVDTVFTTNDAASRLGGNAVGLAAWQTAELSANGRTLKITGTPAQHGPAGSDRGPVTGFLLELPDSPSHVVYISGDTVWFEGIEEIGKQFNVSSAILFMGAARVAEIGPQHLTMTAAEGVQVAQLFSQAAIIPLHFEGWAHFSESREIIAESFEKAGLAHRVCWPELGKPVTPDYRESAREAPRCA